jgi:nucleoside-diphosphate-sugar epimerase
VVAGDVCDAHKCGEALAGCDAVVHVAGVIRARNRAGYFVVNAEGSAAMARVAAKKCPGAMFVLVSSQAAAGPSFDGKPVREQDAPRPVSWYGQSKLAGEDAVAREFPGPWCAIRPSVVYGGGDRGLFELFKTVNSGFAPILAGGRRRVQLIDVGDLAGILFAAAQRPDLSKRRAFAAGDVVTMRELAMFLASLRQPPARAVPVPALAIQAAALFESARQWITGRARQLNLDKAREILAPDWICDSGPLLADLGIASLTPWRVGLRHTCRCYVQAQWLPAALWPV